jgi:ABC-type Fe3+-hydroxamate transport system substrate-binding protein
MNGVDHAHNKALYKKALGWWTLLLVGLAVAGAAWFGLSNGLEQSERDAKTNQSARIIDAKGLVRVASLSPASAQFLRLLGHNTLVARHNYDTFSDQTIAPAGDNSQVDIEVLLAAKPDMVIVERSATGVPSILARACEQHKIALLVVPMLSLDEIPQGLEAIANGLATLKPAAKEDLLKQANQIAESFVQAIKPRPEFQRLGKVLAVYSCSPISIFGPGSYHHDLLVRLGVPVIPTTGKPFMTIDKEDLLALNPSVIVVINPSASAQMAAVLDGLQIDAVRTKRIVLITQTDSLLPGPGLVGLSEKLVSEFSEMVKPTYTPAK